MSEIMIVKQYNPELRGIILSEAELIVRNTLLRYGEGRELTDRNIDQIRGPFIQDVSSSPGPGSGSGEFQIRTAGPKSFIKFFLSQAKGSDIGGKWKKRVVIAPTATVAMIVPGGYKNMSAADPSAIHHVLGLAPAAHSARSRITESNRNAERAAASYAAMLKSGEPRRGWMWSSAPDPRAALLVERNVRGKKRAAAASASSNVSRASAYKAHSKAALHHNKLNSETRRRSLSRGGGLNSRRTRKRRYQ